MRSLAIAVLVACLVLAPTSASAYSDTGWDPDDRRDNGDPDIQSSTRSVFSLKGVRYVKVGLDAFEDLSDWWRTLVGLDTRGGPKVDYWMQFGNYDTGGTECKVWLAADGEASADKGLFKQSGDAASCRVKASLVDRDKRIRWYLRSPSMHSGELDRAPDTGWYR